MNSRTPRQFYKFVKYSEFFIFLLWFMKASCISLLLYVGIACPLRVLQWESYDLPTSDDLHLVGMFDE